MNENATNDSPDPKTDSGAHSLAALEVDQAMIAEEMFASGSAFQGAMLRILAASNQYHVDPIPLLLGLADESPVYFRYELRHLAELIHQGVAPLKALEQVAELLPPACQLGLNLAQQSNSIAKLNTALLNQPPVWEPSELPGSNESLFSKNVRFFFRAFFMFIVVSYIAVRILPELTTIAAEFDMVLPPSLLLLTRLANQFYIFWFLLPIFGLLMLIVWGIPVLRRFIRRFNPLSANLKPLSRESNRRVCLAMARQTGQPIADSLNLIQQIPAVEKLYGRFKSIKPHADREQDAEQNLWRRDGPVFRDPVRRGRRRRGQDRSRFACW